MTNVYEKFQSLRGSKGAFDQFLQQAHILSTITDGYFGNSNIGAQYKNHNALTEFSLGLRSVTPQYNAARTPHEAIALFLKAWDKPSLRALETEDLSQETVGQAIQNRLDALKSREVIDNGFNQQMDLTLQKCQEHLDIITDFAENHARPFVRELEFKNLILDDGALKRLANASDKIRYVLFRQELTSEQSDRLGHCGVAGEFMHSFYFAMPRKLDGGTHENIERLLSIWEQPSQLSSAPERVAGEFVKNETYGQAIPRAIKDLREFAIAINNVSSDDGAKLNDLADTCEKAFSEVKTFVNKHAQNLG